MPDYTSKILLIIFFLAISFSSYKSYEKEKVKRELKEELVELSDIKYGMFNVDEWKNQFATIITKKINELNLTGKDKEAARKKIERFLYTAVEKIEISYKAENQKKAIFGISLKNIGADLFSVFGTLKRNVPKITEDILLFLEKKENRENIKKYILTQLEKYSDSTFQKIDYSRHQEILTKHNTNQAEACKKIISKRIEAINSKIEIFNFTILLSYICILLGIFLFKSHSNFKIIIYILTALHLLALGIFLPMIDIDARISVMEFKLMGEPISFKNQILYYKSKSIMEMSQILLSQGEVKVALVGVLILLFSVIFPIAKLIASILLLIKQRLKRNKAIHFLVFQSGKWSMADVMVVAIFMSYIGFSGIISSQLHQLENISDSLNILTTNHSELQNGFYFFLGFVIISISISQILMNTPKKPTERY